MKRSGCGTYTEAQHGCCFLATIVAHVLKIDICGNGMCFSLQICIATFIDTKSLTYGQQMDKKFCFTR